MALAVNITYTFRDNSNKISTTTIHVPNGFSIAQYSEFADAMAQLLCDLSDGELIDVGISIPLTLVGATIRAVAGLAADVAEKVKFSMASAIGGLRAFLNIPTYDESHNLPSSDAVDLADVEVAAFVAIVEGGSGASPCDIRGNNITEVRWGDEKFINRS